MQVRQRIDDLIGRAERTIRHELSLRRERLDGLRGRLTGMSPMGTLERGYAIVRSAETGTVVRSVEHVAKGDRLSVRVADGAFDAEAT
jgi:exodeoxyribonuclease VII large subunit